MQGVISALVTPFNQDGEIDWEALSLYLDWQLSFRPDCILAMGSTAEANLLEEDEAGALVKYIVKAARKLNVKVMIGAGHASTQKTVELCKKYEGLGADILLVVTPYYVRPSDEGLYVHYREVANSVNAPIMLYNVPSRTGVDISNNTVKALFEIDNIIGIKDATGDLSRIRLLRSITEKYIFSGDDVTCAEALLCGANGVISVISNYQPRLMIELINAVSDSDYYEKWQRIYVPWLAKIGGMAPNPVVIKALMAQAGYMHPQVRLPLLPLASQEYNELVALTNTIFPE